MEITAEINVEDIVQEVMDSSDFDRHVNELVESLVTDQIEEAIGKIDIDDINDFERRVDEITRDIVSEIVDDVIERRVAAAVEQALADPQDADDRVTDLERRVEALSDALASVVSILALVGKVVVPAP